MKSLQTRFEHTSRANKLHNFKIDNEELHKTRL